jgi:hypothetical protein
VRLHDLRHGAASITYRATRDLKAVQPRPADPDDKRHERTRARIDEMFAVTAAGVSDAQRDLLAERLCDRMVASTEPPGAPAAADTFGSPAR